MYAYVSECNKAASTARYPAETCAVVILSILSVPYLRGGGGGGGGNATGTAAQGPLLFERPRRVHKD